MHKNTNRATFAAALIVVGVGWLLVKWGILTSGAAFGAIRLWPLFLILFGAELLLRSKSRELPIWIGPLVIFCATGLIWLFPQAGQWQADGNVSGKLTVAATGPDAELQVQLAVGALELNMAGADQDQISVDYVGLEPVLIQDDSEVKIKSRNTRWSGCGRLSSPEVRWDLRLPRNRPLTLEIDAGAAEITADLSTVSLRSLQVDAGAAEITVRLPEREGETAVSFDTGASDITIEVPVKSAIRLTSGSALSSTNYSGLNLSPRGDALESPDYDTSSHRITIDIDSAVSDVTISRR